MARRSAPTNSRPPRKNSGFSLEAFSVPDDVLKAWREAGSRAAAERQGMGSAFAELGPRKRAEFERRLRHERPASLAKALRDHKKKLLETPQNIATRKSSESAIEAIVAADADGIRRGARRI